MRLTGNDFNKPVRVNIFTEIDFYVFPLNAPSDKKFALEIWLNFQAVSSVDGVKVSFKFQEQIRWRRRRRAQAEVVARVGVATVQRHCGRRRTVHVRAI